MVEAFEIEVRIRNNAIKARRLSKRLTIEEAAELAGVHWGTWNRYELLKTSPLNKKGDWSDTALKIAIALDATPEDLWPDIALKIANPVIKVKASSYHLEQFLEEERARLLPDIDMNYYLEFRELSKDINKSLIATGISDRDRNIVERLFGLSGKPEESYTNLANEYGINRERIAQILRVTLRRLRHPSRSKRLRKYLKE